MTPSATRVAYQRYYPMIRAKCRRMLRDDAEAEDVAQETFLRYWRQPDLHGATPTRVSAWLYKTSTRIAIDVLRKRRTIGIAAEPISRDPSRRHEARFDLDRIARDTPDDELEAVLLHRVDGLTQVEVAEVTGRSERTIRRLLARFDETQAART